MEDAHVAILLEEMRGHFRVFGEAQQGTRDQVTGLAQSLQETRDQVTGLAQSLQETRDELGRKIDLLSADVAVLKADMADIKPRMARVEQHLGLNGAPKASARKGRSPRK
jgi:uncharacterized protein YukE